jgi:hypothetical protein
MRGCLILLLAALVGCAGGSRSGRDFLAETDAAVAALTARGTAHSLATAALLSFVKTALQSHGAARTQQPTPAQALLRQAVALAPDEQALAYLQWRECADSCSDREQIRIHLQALAPSQIRILHMQKDWTERLEASRNSSRESDADRIMLAFYHLPLERPVDWKDPYSS